MHEFHLHVEQTVRAPIERVFAFFSDAGNLESITPPIVGFRILTPQPIAMKAGALIDYSIRLHGLPIRWRTRINAWEPPAPLGAGTGGLGDGMARGRFVDEQLSGPYRVWIHEHVFEACGPGNAWTFVRDHVRYGVPGGPGLERLVERAFIRPRLEQIFHYRKRAIERRLGSRAHSPGH